MSMNKLLILLFFLSACQGDEREQDSSVLIINEDEHAVVTKVEVTGEDRNYNFQVTLKSPDTGCEQYADWWEIVDPQFEFIYRRNLGHSHVNEQPFTRSGGPVDIFEDEEVIIRGHMNSSGYGPLAFRGSVKDGFVLDTLRTAVDLSGVGPVPENCAF